MTDIQSWEKELETFSHFSLILVHHKGKRTRLLSPEGEYRGCLTT